MNRSLNIQSTLLSKLHSQKFLETHRIDKCAFTRKRSLPFVTIVSLILQKMTKSLQIEANLLGELLNRNYTEVGKQDEQLRSNKADL